MEKLVKLLNEYHFSGTEYVGYYLDEKENRIYFRTKVVDKGLVDEQRISDERIISKRFGFIKWLVENDKIELHELSKKELATGWSLENNILDEEDTKENWIKYWTENLLMLLAIQDNPINSLISMLK